MDRQFCFDINWPLGIHDFFHKKCLIFLKDLKSVFFFVKISSFGIIFDLNRKFLLCFKRKQEKFWEKKNRGFGIRENSHKNVDR